LARAPAPLTLLSVLVAACVGYASPRAGRQSNDRKVNPKVLTAALYCAEPNATAESVKSFSGVAGYKVRYLFGVEDPATDRANELHIVSYSKSKNHAWLYEMLVDENAQGEYTLTWLNSAKLLRKGKLWTVSDTLGGIYSYERIRKLVGEIAKTEEIRVPYWQGKPAGVSCKSH
jgi:hypothetical protein